MEYTIISYQLFIVETRIHIYKLHINRMSLKYE